MIIRRATSNDVPVILEIANHAAAHTTANFATEPEPLAQWMTQFEQTQARHPWLVSVDTDGSVTGFAKSGPHKARGAYAWSAELSVYIRHDVRARGVGKALYGCLIPMLREQGFITLLAGITTPNPPSERLHTGFGFTRCSVFHRVGYKFGAFHDVSYFELPLSTSDEPPAATRPVDEVWAGHIKGCTRH